MPLRSVFLAISFATSLLAIPASSRAACAPPSEPADVAISLRLEAGARRVRVDYQFDREVRCIVFADAPRVRTLTWRIDGATLDEDGKTVWLAAPSRSLSLRVDDSLPDGTADRVYTPLLPFADGRAAAVFAAYLEPDRAYGLPTFRFEGVVAAGGADAAPAVVVASPLGSGSRAYFVVGQPQVIAAGRDRFIVDRELPAAVLADVRSTVKQVEGDFAPLRGGTSAISVLVTHSGRHKGPPAWRGDTQDHAVRLNFMGEGWGNADAALRRETRHFVTHELFHLVNGGSVSGAKPGDGRMSLLEGSAEAAAWNALHRRGVVDDAAFGAAFEDAAARCSEVSGDSLGAKERENQRVAPYACGQALAMLLAAAGRLDGEGDPLVAWRILLQGPNRDAADWKDLLDAHRSTTASTSTAPLSQTWSVLAALAASRIGWDGALSTLAQLGLLHAISPEESRTPERSRFHAAAAIHAVLDQHCQGARGYTQFGGVFELDARPESCIGLVDKFRLVAVENRTLDDDGRAAADAQRMRCAQDGRVRWRDESGRTLELACGPLPLPAMRYRLRY
jgi:hypothetical protein